ncbi:site-specific integrase [Clostridium sp. CIES53]
MPRRGENIYKRKDGRWEGRVLRSDGKYRYVYAKSYKEVKEKKRLLQDSEGHEKKHQYKTHTTADLFREWLFGGLSGRVKPSTYESYYRCLTKYVIPFFEKKGNEYITTEKAREFVIQLQYCDYLSDSYKRKILSIFKTALRNIGKTSGDFEAILKMITLPKASGGVVQVFSMKEQRLIEKTVIEFNNKAALGLLCCFYTGIRLGEVCALQWGDIDFDAKTMSVIRTVSRIKNFEPGETKTILSVGMPKSQSSIRKVPLPEFLLDLCRELQIHSCNESCYVLSGSRTPFDPRGYQKLFQRILKQAGVKSRKFHAIRHTFATRALELGVDIKTLSEILGHSSVSITLNIYAHSLFEQKQKAIEKFNAMYLLHSETNTFAVPDSVINA